MVDQFISQCPDKSRMVMRDYPHDVVLAADLDGTLIPLDGHPQHVDDLARLKQLLIEHAVPLLFVTGRHFEDAVGAIEQYGVPEPDYIISALGTLMHVRDEAGGYQLVTPYMRHLETQIGDRGTQELHKSLGHLPGLTLQPPGSQGPFKLSYYVHVDQLDALSEEVERILGDESRFAVTCSFDPNSETAYLDVLPRGMSKAYALNWWCEHTGCPKARVVFAGDSGNDREVFCDGYRTIVVANAKPALARDVWDAHRAAGWRNRLRLTATSGPSGVLEGCAWFEVFPSNRSDAPQILGATPTSFQRTVFRVWAPRRQRVSVEVTTGDDSRRIRLHRDRGGYFVGEATKVGPNDTYRFVLDHQLTRPDPTSRFQPDDVHGDSQVILADNFPWQDAEWRGVPKRDLVIYELHIGSFTDAGTFLGAIERIPYLRELGVTAIELLPVAQSPGKWNWGYDGVGLYAVQHHYGSPDELRMLVDACHEAGIAVILDVVYNHLGPEGNYLNDFAPYFSRKHGTPWGPAFAYDSPRGKPVREYVIDNVLRWLDEYHLDGLRLDAVHFLFDDREVTILDEIRSATRAFEKRVGRTIHLIAESNIYDDHLLDSGRSSDAAYDAIWCDDIMQSIYSLEVPDVRLTPRDYIGASDLAEAITHGYLYETPDVQRVERTASERFEVPEHRSYLQSLVVGLQTHDAVGNHPHGKRFHHLTSTAVQKAASALLLLYPGVPLMFMGEESATAARFPFFVDFHDPGLRAAVDRGRAREYPQHQWEGAPSPSDPEAYVSAQCEQAASDDPSMLDWYRQLLSLRKEWIANDLLNTDRFAPQCDIQRHLFGYSYQIGDQTPVFVVAHLPGKMVRAVEIILDEQTDILLDSRPKTETDSLAPVSGAFAVIGRGRFPMGS